MQRHVASSERLSVASPTPALNRALLRPCVEGVGQGRCSAIHLNQKRIAALVAAAGGLAGSQQRLLRPSNRPSESPLTTREEKIPATRWGFPVDAVHRSKWVREKSFLTCGRSLCCNPLQTLVSPFVEPRPRNRKYRECPQRTSPPRTRARRRDWIACIETRRANATTLHLPRSARQPSLRSAAVVQLGK
jgi:hypothetical protein